MSLQCAVWFAVVSVSSRPRACSASWSPGSEISSSPGVRESRPTSPILVPGSRSAHAFCNLSSSSSVNALHHADAVDETGVADDVAEASTADAAERSESGGPPCRNPDN